ncbi:MAG TPA: cyclic nucleotide-binding domain-containing protein [Alphaproteobacteria bacterium]|nr:cyclic nucleotide-binding domain-containing protein [Alphaproteobacteria bacterium]
MQQEDFDQLRTVPLFTGLSEETLQELTTGAFLQRFPSQTILFRQGDLPDFLHILLDGSVQMTGTSSDARETVVEIVEPVDTFMPAAVLTNTPYLVSAKIIHPARILMLPAPRLREQLARDVRLSLCMLGSLSRQYRDMLRQVKDLKLRTSTQRLGCYLMALAEGNGANGSVELPHDKRLIAARLGMTPESLSRAFSSLRKIGVEVRGHHVRLTDPERLRQHCMPDRLIDSRESNLKVAAA